MAGGRLPRVVDAVIVLAIALGALAGWRKGFVVPLVAQAGALLALFLVFSGPLSANVPSGAAGIGAGAVAMIAGSYILGALGGIVMSLVYRFAIFKRADKVAGVPLGAITAAVTVYIGLVAIITVDGWLAPIHDKGSLTQTDIVQLEQVVARNPAAGAFVDPGTLQMMALAASSAPITTDQMAKFNTALAVYETDVRPQLARSVLVPAFLALGEHIPVLGRHVAAPAP